MTTAAREDVYQLVAPFLRRDLAGCAPKFALAAMEAIKECNDLGIDVSVNEGLRVPYVQSMYYTLGRDWEGKIVEPTKVVTYAKSVFYSWHGFGLALDVRSRSSGSKFSTQWIQEVAEVMKRHGMDWGGDWHRADPPHFQWGTLRAVPSDEARRLYALGKNPAVWRRVGAL